MMRLSTAAAIASLLMFTSASRAAETCPAAVLTAPRAVALQEALFDSLAAEDKATWAQQTTPDFVAHERGGAFDRDNFFDLIVKAHAAGRKIHWSVTSPKLEAGCGLAIMSYTNIGSITAADQQPMPVRWLETVAYRSDQGLWKAFLVTSMRVEDSGATAPDQR